jgi:hypothetical protein
MLIELDPCDVLRATDSALGKVALAVERGHQNRRQMALYEGYRFMLQGALAELAVSLATGYEWTAEHEAFVHDVGPLEVRSRRSATFPLVLRGYELPKHDPQQKFVFCTVNQNYVEIHGWSTIGYMSRFWRQIRRGNDTYETFVIDQSRLHSIETVAL